MGLRLKGHIATFYAAINVTASAVIQVKSGIGDVIWHLPFVRTIAAASPGGCVTFLAPPSSGAKELLAAEPSVAETLYFRHSGSELRRGLNLFLLSAQLRRRRFQQIWILDRTIRPALAATLAGIPERIGLGLGSQRFFITNPGIDQSHFHDQPIDWLIALMAAMNVPLPTTEPDLPVPAATLAEHWRKVQIAAAALDRARHGRFASRQGLVGFLLAGIPCRLTEAVRRNDLSDRRAAKHRAG